MKDITIPAPDKFKRFSINGKTFSFIPRWCSECPFLIKDNPMEPYSDGFCSLRQMRKRRSDSSPRTCLSWMVECSGTGGEFVAVEKD